ncbi:MAG: Nif11-like leader peptide family RiPP precursor [Eubacteriales bacterium]|nr:Nif11-like leader peptide family RiPP precursor [Eubacteriales bacterium]
MQFSKELIEKAKTAKTAEELLEMAKAENINFTAEEAAQALAKMNKNGELSDEELDNVSGGCGRDYEPSGETPKFHVGDRLAMVHPVIGRSIAVRVTYVSSVKSCMNGVNVFTYNTVAIGNKDSYTNVAEYDLFIAEWVK